MLKIWYGEGMSTVNPDDWFDCVFDEKLLLTDFSKSLLKGIEKCEVISENLVVSDILGPVAPSSISGGSKSVLCMMYDEEYVVNLANCGNNLIPYIRKVSDIKDVTVVSTTPFSIFNSDYGDYNGRVLILNNGEIVDNERGMLKNYFRYVRGVEL